MLISGGTLAPVPLIRRVLPLLAIFALALAPVAMLAGSSVALGPLLRVAAAACATALMYAGWREAEGRERRVRGWIGFAVYAWLLSELWRLAGTLTGAPNMLAELSVVGLSVGAVGTYVTAARGRMRTADEIALYLDGAAVFLGLAGAVVVIGSGWVHDSAGMAVLLHAAFFVGVVASTLLLHLSTHVPLRLRGPWEVVLGLALGAAGYLGLLVPATSGAMVPLLHIVVAGGALLVGHGGASWTAAEDRAPGYLAVAGWLRALLPLGSAVVTGAVIIAIVTQPTMLDGVLRTAVGAALGIAVVAAIARQTMLLIDREGIARRERQLADELTVAEAQYRSVVERVPGVVYVAEAGQHGRWHFVSPKIQDLLGYSADEWMADSSLWMERMHPADRERMILAETEDRQRTGPQGRWEYRLIARDGRVVWVIDDEAVIARDNDGQPTMVQGILVDISDRKGLEEQLRHQALHDPLTGLPNRVLFIDRLSHALVRRRPKDSGVAVLFVDLDDFKEINDSHGHAAGDELLQLVGARLSGVLRPEDTAGRLGGDEFAFLIEDVRADDLEHIAERIIRALSDPFDLGGRTVSLSASIGIATRDRLTGSNTSAPDVADELLRDADTAMYAAKSLGKGRVRVFDRRMHEPIARRRALRASLEHALVADQLMLEYQPIVDMRTRETVGLEALVRWDHPQLGRLLPADFVPLAEESRLIDKLGDWVLRRACRELVGETALVSVNVSAHQLGAGDLPKHVEAALRESGLPPSQLLLELTESTLASAGAGAETELQRIQALGVRIALDDFGSGYSSLEYLGRLPIDVLKIDRSLVERVHLEPQRQEVVRAIGHIARKLKLRTIVEGVEQEAQRTVLLDLGFRQAQGFLFSAAVPLSVALPAREEARAS